MNVKLNQILYICGGILALLGAMGQLANIPYAAYVFSAGAACIIYTQFVYYRYSPEESTRQQRQKRIGFISSLLPALGAYFMFTASNSWVLALLIYGISTFVLSFRSKN